MAEFENYQTFFATQAPELGECPDGMAVLERSLV